MTEKITVATSGKKVPRSDRCEECDSKMLYRVDDFERVVSRFCDNYRCTKFCKEIAEGDAALAALEPGDAKEEE